MNKSYLSLTALLSLLLLAPAAWAQDATGKIAGNITDATGALIAGATVVVTSLDTRITKRTVANSQGFYQILQLPIGHYEVSAEAIGIQQKHRKAGRRSGNQSNAPRRSDVGSGCGHGQRHSAR